MVSEVRTWSVYLSTAAKKQVKVLLKEHPQVYAQFAVLAKEIEILGPYRTNWLHFSALGKRKGIPQDSYHCHVKGGKPTYVACWYIEDKKVKIVEIYYVGTHEKAPY
ncbi:MAG: hypothetical protein WCF65_03760 [Parachlamydiaceae bacterium]